MCFYSLDLPVQFMKLGDSSHNLLFESSIFRERQTKFTNILEHTDLQTRMAFFSYKFNWKIDPL